VGLRKYYILNDPELIQQVLVTQQRSFHKGRGFDVLKALTGDGLVTSEGDLHLRQRRMIQPMFHKQRIATYADLMVSLAERRAQAWQDGETLDLYAEMSYLTMLIVNQALFDMDVESAARELGEVITTLTTSYTYTLGLIGKLRMRLPLPYTKRILAARERLENTIHAMIAKRRAEGDQGDLLSLLIAARDDEDEPHRMSDKQVRDEALTLFIAGNETTANALTWTFYLLSQNPVILQRLRAELDRVLQGRSPVFSDIESLSYTRMVFSEALRLYPPAWIMLRKPIEDVQIGDYLVPKGASVILCQWITHHNERYYPNPLEFDPERWRPEASAARPKMAFFPFGGGARGCIGEQFAWMEGILIVATIAQKWDMRLELGFPVELLAEITLRPKHGIRMIVTRRSS
jgi:cytochrome P450